MVTNQLKIHDSKTKFIVLRSPQLKCDLRDDTHDYITNSGIIGDLLSDDASSTIIQALIRWQLDYCVHAGRLHRH